MSLPDLLGNTIWLWIQVFCDVTLLLGEWLVSHVWKDHGAFIFRSQAVFLNCLSHEKDPMKYHEPPPQQQILDHTTL